MIAVYIRQRGHTEIALSWSVCVEREQAAARRGSSLVCVREEKDPRECGYACFTGSESDLERWGLAMDLPTGEKREKKCESTNLVFCTNSQQSF
jgi:hypothetical protein